MVLCESSCFSIVLWCLFDGPKSKLCSLRGGLRGILQGMKEGPAKESEAARAKFVGRVGNNSSVRGPNSSLLPIDRIDDPEGC